MNNTSPIHVYSEIGRLKKVLLHRPGKELENLVPNLLEELLFDDIPFLKVAQEEHDAFSSTLKNLGVEVVYVENLLAEALDTDKHVKDVFLTQFIREAGIYAEDLTHALKEFLMGMPTQEMVYQLIAGLRKEELPNYKGYTLDDYVNAHRIFILSPMPNLLFMRDPFASIGHGVTINTMHTHVRQRETLFLEYIFKYHPWYKDAHVPHWFDRYSHTTLEGGDELVLSDTTLAIGISQRTQPGSIEQVARNLFAAQGNTFKQVLAVEIPAKRAFMHLDTVLTQVDKDKFTIFSQFDEDIRVFILTPGSGSYGLNVKEEVQKIDKTLSQVLDRKVELIPCGGGHVVDSAREQWNDGANTLCVAPGEVVVYNRNHVTNALLESKGIKIHPIPSSELSRGRGGPRCMSMPLFREKL